MEMVVAVAVESVAVASSAYVEVASSLTVA